jgi:shikimate dehydrogenase
MRKFGLIGFPLSHSFSKKYFSEKFEKEGIANAEYELYPLNNIDLLPSLLAGTKQLRGLNVTIPYKQAVLPFLTEIDDAARKIGAVNVLKISENGDLKGYNSDYYGFKTSLEKYLEMPKDQYQAIVLGTGGASKAVKTALEDLGIPFKMVSRTAKEGVLSYEQISSEQLAQTKLIINTTPLGMSPNVHDCPPLPYEAIGSQHVLYDLVYNPEVTEFMKRGKERGAVVVNGLEMLYLQAEKSWEIWNS